jgi:hypothetical protein
MTRERTVSSVGDEIGDRVAGTTSHARMTPAVMGFSSANGVALLGDRGFSITD